MMTQGIIGNSIPGTWRPFSKESPWNKPISALAMDHIDSDRIMELVQSRARAIRFANIYKPTLWVINGKLMPKFTVRSTTSIYDTWDADGDDVVDEPVPIVSSLYPEPTPDGHIILIDVGDPTKPVSIEMSKHYWEDDGGPRCSTYNVWELNGPGWDDPPPGTRWTQRGGRGSGFPVIAGLLRPEDLDVGKIRHALVCTFDQNRDADDTGAQIFLSPPACRSDGRFVGQQYPIEGMRFQLDPTLTEADFDRWDLTSAAKVVARALQRYGMYLGDNGGAMAIQTQLLGRSEAEDRLAWDARFPGLFSSIDNIPTRAFRIVEEGATLRIRK